MKDDTILLALLGSVLVAIAVAIGKLGRRIIVGDDEIGLYLRRDRIVACLSPGEHRLTQSGDRIIWFDRSWKELEFQPVDRLTADGTRITVSGSASFRISDVSEFYLSACRPVEDLEQGFETAAQLAVKGRSLNTIVGSDSAASYEIRVRLATTADEMGLEFDALVVHCVSVQSGETDQSPESRSSPSSVSLKFDQKGTDAESSGLALKS